MTCLGVSLLGSACSKTASKPSLSAADDDAAVAVDGGERERDAGSPDRRDAAADAATGEENADAGSKPRPTEGRDAAQESDAAQDAEQTQEAYDLDVAAFSKKLAAAVCESLRSCLGEQKLRAFVDDEVCEERFAASFAQSDFATLRDSVERGRVELHSDELDNCYKDTRALGCAIQTERLPASCQAAFQGTVARGDTCTSGADCKGESYCAAGECPRVCKARGAAADSCARDEECKSGLICVQGQCAAPAAIDEACGGTSNGVCALGTSCVGSTKDQPGSCAANADVQVGELGAVCTPGGTLCQEGLSCAYDGDQGFNCQQAVESGATCHLALPTMCPASEYCTAEDVTAEGRCSALPTEGQACVLGSECAGGHACVSSSENSAVCRRVRDLAEACEVDAMCRSGRCAQGKCAAPAVCD